MTALWTILGIALALYLLRLSGFLAAEATVPEVWTRALKFVPIATLTALVTSSLAARPDEAPVRLLAAAGATLVAWRTRSMWLCIVAGMGIYVFLRFV